MTDHERVLGQLERGEVWAGPSAARAIAARHEAAYGDAFGRPLLGVPTVRYLVVDVLGRLSEHIGTRVDFDAVLGPEGPARVQLHPSTLLSGWVSDIGHRDPERFPRNTVGSCMLRARGAYPYPYAGPVVITGWRHGAHEYEISSLDDRGVAAVRVLHKAVRDALADLPVPEMDPSWAETIRGIAAHVHSAPTPRLTFRSLRQVS